MAFLRTLYVLLLVAGTAQAEVTLERATKAGVAFDRGLLHVRENRAKPGSRTIAIGFARLRSRHPERPPIFFLYGGPGASYLDAFDEATPNANRRFSALRRYAEVADVVVLDQRGFSKRGTTLVVPAVPPQPPDQSFTVARYTATWFALARAAAAANPGADLAGYTLQACAADVDELRRALGYPQIVLLGGSFGSQESFAIMRLFPAIVARAVLFGVEPLDNGLDMPSHVFAAMQRIAHATDPTLIPKLRELRERFARGPVKIDTLVLGLEDFQRRLADLRADTLPAFVRELHRGDYAAWARAEREDRTAPPFTALITPIIDSGIGVTPPRRYQLETDPAIELLGTWSFAPHLATRGAWPSADLTDVLRTPVRTEIPVVFVNGDWDMSTPVENMLQIAPYFTNSRSIVVHRGEHDQLSYMLRGDAAAFTAILAFLATGATAQLPAEVTAP